MNNKYYKKVSFAEMEAAMLAFNKEHNITDWSADKPKLYAIVCFDNKSFKKTFSEPVRSYLINNMSNAFFPNKISFALSGDCLDNNDTGVRLDWYMRGNEHWTPEYCYIIEDMNVIKVSKEDGSEKPVSLYDTLCLTEGRGYLKTGTVAQMLAEGQEVQTPWAIFKKAV